jgi:tRNA-binding protein
MKQLEYEDFARVEIRVGTIVEVGDLPRARKPMYRLRIDFGAEVGVLQSAAGLPARYRPDDLTGRQVIAAVNLGSRNIAGFESQCLTLGLPDESGEPILLVPTCTVPNGGRLF